MTDTVATGVSHAELATLKRIALQGGRAGPVKISCSGLASELDVSNQTASRRLQALEETGLIDRDIVSDGQWVSVTEDGETQLRHEYEDYRRIFEEAATLKLTGVVTLGMGEGRHYISLPGYMEQFEEKLGYEPYAGTFNLVLTKESVRVRAAISSFDGIRIEGWEAEDRTYGPATCYPATLLFDGKSYEPAHVIIPDRTHHDENQLEIIAPDRLRDKLDVADDDEVTVVVEDV